MATAVALTRLGCPIPEVIAEDLARRGWKLETVTTDNARDSVQAD